MFDISWHFCECEPEEKEGCENNKDFYYKRFKDLGYDYNEEFESISKTFNYAVKLEKGDQVLLNGTRYSVNKRWFIPSDNESDCIFLYILDYEVKSDYPITPTSQQDNLQSNPLFR